MSIDKLLLLVGDEPDNTQNTVDLMIEFVNAAKTSLHIAIYDFRLNQPQTLQFTDALEKKAQAGVDVKIAYDHRNPPSSSPGSKAFVAGDDDPAPKGTHEFLTSGFGHRHPNTKVQVMAIQEESIAGSKLMHQKVIVCDSTAVLMGSANFSDDAWAHQDNNILTLSSPDLADYYENDFKELWSTGRLSGTGEVFGTVHTSGLDVDVRFSPAQGRRIDGEIAALIDGVQAGKAFHIASMVITSDKILASLEAALDRGVEVHGIYDGPEMSAALHQMTNPAKIALMNSVMAALTAKHSVPFDPKKPQGLHNFMHDKIAVAGGTVVTGSYNFSSSAEGNSEDILFIRDMALADQYRTYVDRLIARWGSAAPS
ncbi:MAG: phosphatidylserine/phosphatidylglycerophosphate/cardiolipin synthase family protein [Polyangia bacterium]